MKYKNRGINIVVYDVPTNRMNQFYSAEFLKNSKEGVATLSSKRFEVFSDLLHLGAVFP